MRPCSGLGPRAGAWLLDRKAGNQKDEIEAKADGRKPAQSLFPHHASNANPDSTQQEDHKCDQNHRGHTPTLRHGSWKPMHNNHETKSSQSKSYGQRATHGRLGIHAVYSHCTERHVASRSARGGPNKNWTHPAVVLAFIVRLLEFAGSPPSITNEELKYRRDSDKTRGSESPTLAFAEGGIARPTRNKVSENE